jgi:alpha-N-arabinofuranosidase
MDAFIEAVVATADHVGARKRSRKKLKLSFDEWNVWYQQRFVGQSNLDWRYARPLIEDEYHVADAVVVGSLLISLLRHADRVGIACQAQLANVIAPIRTQPGGPAWTQTIFHPFAQAARHARGEVLRVDVRAPQHDTARYGEVPLVTATATHHPETGELCVLAVNRAQDEPLGLDVTLAALGRLRVVEHAVLAEDDLHASNTRDAPDRVRPRPASGADVTDGRLRAVLPPVSWNVLRLAPQPG